MLLPELRTFYLENKMKTAVFSNDKTVIVVGLDKKNNPLDIDGTLFGPESGRDIEDFKRTDFNPSRGEVVVVEPIVHTRVE